MPGWMKLYRQIKDHKMWLDKPFSRGQAWLDILLNTSYGASSFWARGICIQIKPGQCSMSVLNMAERWGWSRGKVSRFLLYLENEHQIKQQKNNVTTLITVLNWDKYQDKGQQNGHQNDTKQTPDGHIKEGKKGKEVKHKHGEFKNVLLTDKEEQKLKDKFNGSFAEKIKDMDEAIEMKDYKYKSHYLAILKWDRDKPKDNDIYSAEIYK